MRAILAQLTATIDTNRFYHNQAIDRLEREWSGEKGAEESMENFKGFQSVNLAVLVSPDGSVKVLGAWE